ncbi:MAG: guanylate kinase [Agathobacter sp.]|nr:guanylate kinase [Agathobacter sp.]
MGEKMNKGILVVASGFSGAGKGTIMKKLMSEYGENYALSISATTRAPRSGEEHGREYFFLTTEEFEAMIERDELVEYAKYVSNYYGTPKAYVEEQLEAGKNVILEIEIQGALKIKEKFPETVLLFITAPSAEELKGRLIGRGTETQDVIDARMSRAYEVSLGVENYDYLVVNDDLDTCVALVNDIISKEKAQNADDMAEHRISANIDFINNMRKELLSFSKGV